MFGASPPTVKMARGPGTSGPLALAVVLATVVVASSCLVGTAPRVEPARTLAAFVPSPSERTMVASPYAPAPGVAALGPVGANTSMTVDVGLASRDPAGLAAFVDASSIPGTPAFGRFLAAGAADARFGALAGSVATAEGYFSSFGLSTTAHPDGLLLSVRGPADAVARAFGTTLDLYRSPSGTTFVSHPTAATLPEIAPWTGVLGLDTQMAMAPEVATAPLGRFGAAGSGCVPEFGSLSSCQLANVYDFAGLEAGGTNGTGKTIAVVDTYSAAENQTELASDFASFNSSERLPPAHLTFAYPVRSSVDLNASGTNAAWRYEDALDVEWSHAAAPGAVVTMVFSPNPSTGLYFAVDWVVAAKAADVISMSWGEPEVGVFNAVSSPCAAACNASSDGSFAILDPVLELGAAEGISTFAASGDCGSSGGTSGVSVFYPASDPFVTGVGATNLTLTPAGAYKAEDAWGGNSSGGAPGGCSNQGGSGGGYSVLPRPWWQAGPGTSLPRGRGVPDVAMVGGVASPVAIVVGGAVYDVYGTSVGTPIWAGIAALLDQAHSADLGWLNPGLYRILGGANYSEDFHDILTGSNGYPAHAGWDPVTGIGTPIVANLSRDLGAGIRPASNLTTFVYASPRFGTVPLTVDVALQVTGGSGTYPLEGVTFGDGNASAVVAGRAAHTFTAPGVYSVEGYASDATGNSSTSPAVVVVVGGGGPLTVSLTANRSVLPANATVAFAASVSGGSPPYEFNVSFGDGAMATNLTANSTQHTYRVAGGFCAEVVVRDSGRPPDGAASLRVPVTVGGAPAGSCGNPSSPLTLRASSGVGVRDAPADFPSLFVATGGTTAPFGLLPQLGFASTDPYTAACSCAILRAAGSYVVHGWENDSVGEGATAETNVTVAPALRATFDASTLSGPVPLTVTFTASATGGYLASASATSWTFGNGRSAAGARVTFTYTTPGEYLAVASLSDGGDGNASEAFLLDAQAPFSSTVGVTGTVTPAVNVSSGASVLWSATPVGPPAEIAGSVVAWNLGNGEGAFGPAANETYFAPGDEPPGNRLLASVAVDAPGLTTLVRVPVDLPGFFATEVAQFVPAVDALYLSADVAPVEGFLPLPVAGLASASGPGGTAVAWTFGDGGSGVGASVRHVYTGAGAFTVRADATDGFSDQASRLVAVVVNSSLALLGCGPSLRYGNAPFTLQLAPGAEGGAGPPYTYTWILPNGSVSHATSLNFTFSAIGTYALTLVVHDAGNGTTDCGWTVVVTSVPGFAFLAIVAGAVGVGVALAVVFVWAARPGRKE
jgi:PKD repeat protein